MRRSSFRAGWCGFAARVAVVLGVLWGLSPAALAGASAIMGTYSQTSVMVADGTTVYTAWVYADNRPLGGEPTWGTQHDFFLPPYATLIPGGLGVAYGKPPAERDFFEGNPMVFETFAGPGLASGRLVNMNYLVSDHIGDVQFYKFTINTDAPLGAGNFDLGAETTLTNASAQPQPFVEVNIPFTITALSGDFNFDGFVGIADLNTVLGNWNNSTPVPGVQPGDYNGDGFVGIADLNWVLGNWNAGTPPANGSNVPEPASLLCLAAGVLGVLGRAGRNARMTNDECTNVEGMPK